METGSNALLGRRWGAISLAALLALTLAMTGGSAGATDAGNAVAAKKKCKFKKFKNAAATAKKKKCRKRVPAPPPPAAPVLPPPGPLVRATMSWTSNVDVDLHAYDASGNHSGWTPGGVVQGIPNAVHSGDVGTAGSETFTDNIFVRGGTTNREFSFIACFYGNTAATFIGVTSTGNSTTIPVNGQAGDFVTFAVPGGPATPDPNVTPVC